MPRYVLQHAHNEEQQRLLDSAIRSVSICIESVALALRDYAWASEATAQLVHIRVSCCRHSRQ